jgi:hypothetical protein
MSKPDEFEATKQIVALLEPFDSSDDRERILRWVRDKLRMLPSPGGPGFSPMSPAAQVTNSEQPSDIRSFIEAKNPRTDTQLVAVVAYFHRFVAPESQRRDSIGKDDVLTACRLAQRARPSRIDQTMVNAFTAGYFDRAERGQYRLNSVGENLVAVALPGSPGSESLAPVKKRSKSRKKPPTRGSKRSGRASKRSRR